MVLSIGTPNSDTNLNLLPQPTNGNDEIYGRGRDDSLSGLSGDDVMYGDRKPASLPPLPLEFAGSDTLRGNAGNDRLFGELGNDMLDGGSDQDSLFGDTGNDRLFGGSEDDVLDGGSGEDDLYGGTGNDRLFGGDQNDYLNGGDGSDRVDGGAGNDAVYGGAGNDSVNGGVGLDAVYGVDPILVNPGRGEVDSLFGGSNSDNFYLGNAQRVFYDSGAGGLGRVGMNDYGRIADFTDGQDTIYLKGSESYILDATVINGASGTGIYQRELVAVSSPSGVVFGFADELIGFVAGVSSASLTLTPGNSFSTIT
jgi:Ca2+-binding RTX toxin-like protein